MKTLGQYPGLIGAVISRGEERQKRRRAWAERRRAIWAFVVKAFFRPVVAFALGFVICLALFGSLLAHLSR